MAGARPRRSTVAVSYQIGFPTLPGSSESESSAESESERSISGEVRETVEEGFNDKKHEPTGEQKRVAPAEHGEEARKSQPNPYTPASKSRKKRFKHAQDEDDEPESSSGSEYAPEVIKGKDGTLLETVESDDVAELDDVELEEEEQNDNSTGEDEDFKGSIAGSDDEIPTLGTTGSVRQGLKGKGKAITFVASPFIPRLESGPSASVTPKPIHVVGRTPLAVHDRLSKKSVPKRKPTTGSNNFTKKIPSYDMTYGPAFFPPRFENVRDFDDACHCSRAGEGGNANTNPSFLGLQHASSWSPRERLLAVKRTAYLPFGPRYDVCEDVSWYKGKWEYIEQEGQRVELRSKRWGGWYEHVSTKTSSFDVITDIEAIVPCLPHNVYPARPSAIHLSCMGKGLNLDKTEDADGDEDIWDVGTSDDTSFNFAIPPSNTAEAFSSAFKVGTSRIRNMPSPKYLQERGTEHADDGVVRISMGLLGPSVASQNSSETPQIRVELDRFSAVRLDNYLPQKPGHMLNAGGPVWGLDWCPQPDDDIPAAYEYLAVSTVSQHYSIEYRRASALASSRPCRSGLIQLWSLDTSVGSDLAMSTSSVNQGRGMRLEMALLLKSESIQIQWCPKGGEVQQRSRRQDGAMHIDVAPGQDLERLGILATLSADGALAIYGIPKLESIREKMDLLPDDLVFLQPKGPLLKLDLGIVPISTFDWASHSMLVAGSSTGQVAVYYIEDALNVGLGSVAPTHFFPMHETAIRMITAIREPALDAEGRDKLDEEPTRIATASLDGSTKMVDLQDWGSVFDFGHERAIRTTTCFQPSTGGLLYGDQEIGIRYICLRMRDLGASTRIVSQNGPVTHIACSDFHSFLASASTDGSCAIGNSVRRLKRAGHAAHYLTKLYRMDMNRKTGEMRMIDNIIPDSRVNHESRTAARKRARDQKAETDVKEDDSAAVDTLSSLAWPAEVAVNRVAWSKSLRRAHLLASGMACGLVRVDVTARPWSMEASTNVRFPPKSAAQEDDDDEED